MTRRPKPCIAACFLSILIIVFVTAAPAAADGDLPTVRPAKVGFSPERLQRLDDLMERLIKEQEFYGAVTVAARHGKVFHHHVAGMRDQEAGKPMTRDTLFRIFSMTKPIIGAAMMMLYEEGKWKLDDPIHKHIPEFRDLMVYAGEDDNGDPILEQPEHAPTLRELMTHTAGFTYGIIGDTPVDRMYREKDVLDWDSSLDAMIDKLAGLPLQYQPGSRWVYSISVDIQGYLVEKLSGQSLPEFLQERLFEPLDMRDTGFYVPKEKRDRLTRLYSRDEDKQALRLTRDDEFGGRDYTSPPGLASGGAGLVSTSRDYLRFSQMLLNGGELDGVRILAPGTVELLRANHLPDGLNVYPGTGFGMDFAVTTDPVRAGTLAGKGTFFWGGAAGTWFWIDPEHDIILVGMIQRMGAGAPGTSPDIRHLAAVALYQALVEPEK